MYGKFFSSTFTGSMLGSGADVFAVWGYVIANTVQSQVELNPQMLAPLIGMTPEAAEQAIAFLCAPDPYSRSKVEEGRRLIREGQFAYRVPNSETYRAVRNEDDRREYNRQKQAGHRLKKSKRVKARVNDSQSLSTMSAQAEAEAEAEATKDLRASVVYARYLELFPGSRLSFPSASRLVGRAPKQFSAEELVEAIEGNAGDPWHAERGKHELSYVLRNEEKIDQFRELRRRQLHPRLVGVGGNVTVDELEQMGIKL